MALRSQTQRTLLLGFIVSIASCGLVGVYCLLQGRMGSFEGRVLGTTATVGACSILALAAAVPWERRRWHPIGPVGLAAVIVAMVLTIIAIWSDAHSQPWARVIGCAWVCAVALPHIGLLSLARLRSQWKIFQTLTVIFIVILACQIILMIVLEFSDEGWIRATGIFGIGVACGTIAVPILHRVSAIRLREAVRTTELSISITCPRCATTQELSVGRSCCKNCSLRFIIEIEEDNCAKCGYPLYMLKSAVCPECGTPISNAPAGARPA